MALNANALTTVETLKNELSITDSSEDLRLERLINTASQQIENYLGRQLYYDAAIEEKRPGYTSMLLRVDVTPIVSITEITYNDSVLDSDNYEIHDADAGLIYNTATWITTAPYTQEITQERVWGEERKLYQVTYAGGWVTPEQGGTVTLPSDIEDACVRLSASRYNQIGRDSSITQEKLGDWSATYGGQSSSELSTSGGIPPAIRSVLDTYRRAVIG